MQKYTIARKRKKFPIWLFLLLVLGILMVELYYFEILYKKRIKYLNVPDYKPISLSVGPDLSFIDGDLPLFAKFHNLNLFLFKNFSLTLNSSQILEVYSNNPYHLIFSDNRNKYEFFGKILYLRCSYGTN
jgi:hypothetical protein